MKIKMTLLSDAVFGNGMSIPGQEDISVLVDGKGFPFYKGGTFKGIFREELERYLTWVSEEQDPELKEKKIQEELGRLLGQSGSHAAGRDDRLVFSDFHLSGSVCRSILEEIPNNKDAVTECLTNMRTFTSVSRQGTAEKGSLRYARCVDKGLVFYSTIKCAKEDEALVENVIRSIRWVGTMRNRGFGKVMIEPEE